MIQVSPQGSPITVGGAWSPISVVRKAAPPITILREGDNEASLSGDTTGVGGTGATVTRVSNHPIEGTWSVAHHAGPSSGAGNIVARRFVNNPAGAVEDQPWGALGDELWWGGWYEFQDADPHDYTAFHRMADSSGQNCVLQAVFESAANTLRVDLEDYGGTPTGVGNTNHFASVAATVDAPFFIEIGALLSNDAEVGWCELWLDGVQVGSRSTGQTLKLAANQYMHLQVGLGNYNVTAAGREATIWTDDWYIADGRRGP